MNQAFDQPVGVLDEGRVLQKNDEQICHESFNVGLLNEVYQHRRHLGCQVRVAEDILDHYVFKLCSQLFVMPVGEVLNPYVVLGGVHEVGIPEIQEVRAIGNPNCGYQFLLPKGSGDVFDQEVVVEGIPEEFYLQAAQAHQVD